MPRPETHTVSFSTLFVQSRSGVDEFEIVDSIRMVSQSGMLFVSEQRMIKHRL